MPKATNGTPATSSKFNSPWTRSWCPTWGLDTACWAPKLNVRSRSAHSKAVRVLSCCLHIIAYIERLNLIFMQNTCSNDRDVFVDFTNHMTIDRPVAHAISQNFHTIFIRSTFNHFDCEWTIIFISTWSTFDFVWQLHRPIDISYIGASGKTSNGWFVRFYQNEILQSTIYSYLILVGRTAHIRTYIHIRNSTVSSIKEGFKNRSSRSPTQLRRKCVIYMMAKLDSSYHLLQFTSRSRFACQYTLTFIFITAMKVLQ